VTAGPGNKLKEGFPTVTPAPAAGVTFVNLVEATRVYTFTFLMPAAAVTVNAEFETGTPTPPPPPPPPHPAVNVTVSFEGINRDEPMVKHNGGDLEFEFGSEDFQSFTITVESDFDDIWWYRVNDFGGSPIFQLIGEQPMGFPPLPFEKHEADNYQVLITQATRVGKHTITVVIEAEGRFFSQNITYTVIEE